MAHHSLLFLPGFGDITENERNRRAIQGRDLEIGIER